MTLFFRGIEVPPLGSSRDIVFRQYLVREARVEAKRAELMAAIAVHTPTYSEQNKADDWTKVIRRMHSDFVVLSMGSEPVEQDDEEAKLLEFYEKRVKTTRPTVRKTAAGLVLDTEGFDPFMVGRGVK